ncbi:MAG: hypothetical protein FJX71_01355 [Alphaproteobacteria bacterium]|nr:hypothetical protein [Alphaproteobacteria bacterium]
MSGKAAHILLELTRSALTGAGEVGEHPSVMYPMHISEPELRKELFEVQDRALARIPGYQEEVMPHGITMREWIKEEEVAEGLLTKYIQSTVDGYQSMVLGMIRSSYEQIDRVYRAVGEDVAAVIGFFSKKKTDLFGSFPPERSKFIDKLKGQNPYLALRYSYQMSNKGFDRLVGYGIRREVLKKGVIKEDDKIRIQEGMDKYLPQYHLELEFWVDRFLNLRLVYDVLHQVKDGYAVFAYKERTGAKAPWSTKNPWLWFQIEQKAQNALYGNLLNSFRIDTLKMRNPGLLTRSVETVVNGIGSAYAREIGAADPGPYLERLKEAQEKVKEAQEEMNEEDGSLVAYLETPAFTIDRVFDFFEAIRMDFRSLARQIALNGRLAKNTDLNWQDELNRLKDYETLLKALFFIQDEFYKLRLKLAKQLTDPANASLREAYVEANKGEYGAQKARNELRMSYQKTLQGEIHGKNQYIWNTWVGGLKDIALRYMITNEAFEKCPLYKVCAPSVQGKIGELGALITNIRRLLGKSTGNDSDLNFDAITSEQVKGEGTSLPLQPVNASSATREIRIQDDYVGDFEKLRKPMGPPSKPMLRASVFDLASPDQIAQIKLITRTRFYTAEGYELFIDQPTFTEIETIEDAITLCEKNNLENQPGWDWRREGEDLVVYLNFIKRIYELSKQAPSHTSSDVIQSTMPMSLADFYILPPKARFDKLRNILFYSFLKKFNTDYGAYLRAALPPIAPLQVGMKASASGLRQWVSTEMYLWKRSGVRKAYRAVTNWGAYRDAAPHFRDPAFIAEVKDKLRMTSEVPGSSLIGAGNGGTLDEKDGKEQKYQRGESASSSSQIETDATAKTALIAGTQSVKSAAPSLGSSPVTEEGSEFRQRLPVSADVSPEDRTSLPKAEQSSEGMLVKFDNEEEYKVLLEKAPLTDLDTIKTAIGLCNQNMEKQKQGGWNWAREKMDLTLYYLFLECIDDFSHSLPVVSGGVTPPPVSQFLTFQSSQPLTRDRLEELRDIFYESFLKKFHSDYATYLRSNSSWFGMRSINEGYLAMRSGARKTARAYKSWGTTYQNSAPEFRDITFLKEVARELKLETLMPSALTDYDKIDQMEMGRLFTQHSLEYEMRKKEKREEKKDEAKGERKLSDGKVKKD